METALISYDVRDEAHLTCDIVSAGFRNLMPEGAKVVIIQIKAKVTYSDGTFVKLGPRDVSIAPGGTDQVLMTGCSEKCVTSITGEMTVRDSQGGGSRDVILEKTRTADPGKCLLVGIFPLGRN